MSRNSGFYLANLCHSGFATRTCLEDGGWYYNPEFNRTWTNYSECLQVDDFTNGVPDIILVMFVSCHKMFHQILNL